VFGHEHQEHFHWSWREGLVDLPCSLHSVRVRSDDDHGRVVSCVSWADRCLPPHLKKRGGNKCSTRRNTGGTGLQEAMQVAIVTSASSCCWWNKSSERACSTRPCS
ncbi:unnamed protein product, partial [Ectocarpus sp. 12 AP-2014]